MRISARIARFVGVLAVGTLFVAACGSDNGGGDETTIQVAGIPPFSVTAWPLVVAEDQGYFAEEGIAVEETFTFDGGQLLAGDQVDMINDGADTGLQAAIEGKDVIAVAPLAGEVTDGLLASTDFATVADLEGATLRTSGFGTDEFLLREFLEANGVDPDSIEYASVEDDGAALAQLEAGEIDGGMFDQGILFEAEQEGGDQHVLAEPADLGEFPWNTIQTTTTFAEANPEAVTGFIAAVQRAIEFIQDPANRDAVIAAVVDAGEGIGDVEATYAAASPFGLYSVEIITIESVQDALRFIEEFSGPVLGGVDVADYDLGQYVDDSYAP